MNNNGATEYTRAGNFQMDLSGNLLTPSGQQVQGWMATNGVVNTGGPIGNITVPVGTLQAPQATTEYHPERQLRLLRQPPARASDWSAPITVYDSLGTAHVLTLNFAADRRQHLVLHRHRARRGCGRRHGGRSPPARAPCTLRFNSSGQLTVTPPAGSPIALSMPGLSDGAAAMSINWNPDNADGTGTLTQFDQSSATSANTQDGSAAAQLTW